VRRRTRERELVQRALSKVVHCLASPERALACGRLRDGPTIRALREERGEQA